MDAAGPTFMKAGSSYGMIRYPSLGIVYSSVARVMARCCESTAPSALLTYRLSCTRARVWSQNGVRSSCFVASVIFYFVRSPSLNSLNSLRACVFSVRQTQMAFKKSSRAEIVYRVLGLIIWFFVALAFVNSSVALDLVVALQQNQAFSSSRCVMNEFSSSISTVR